MSELSVTFSSSWDTQYQTAIPRVVPLFDLRANWIVELPRSYAGVELQTKLGLKAFISGRTGLS